MAIATTTPPIYFAAGAIRGEGPDRATVRAAIRDVERDRAECKKLGGYSDRAPIAKIAGREYSVAIVTDDDGSIVMTDNARLVEAIIQAVGEDIAQGNGRYYPRLKLDRWSGWAIAGKGLYRVAVSWPDGAESHEVEPKIDHICDLV